MKVAGDRACLVTRRSTLRFALLGALTLVAVWPSRSPALIIADGGVHDIDYVINDRVEVDPSHPGLGTTVNLLPGGSIGGNGINHFFNDSHINIMGGESTHTLAAWDRATVYMTDGFIGGGLGALSGSVHIEVHGGTIDASLGPNGNSTIELWGGTVGMLDVRSSSRCEWWGGTLTEYNGLGASVTSTSLLTIYGADFAIDGTPVSYGDYSGLSGQLTGWLANGDAIDNSFEVDDAAVLRLVDATTVPDPGSTLLLFGLALAGLAVLRRKLG